jgi:hypothetical protein
MTAEDARRDAVAAAPCHGEGFSDHVPGDLAPGDTPHREGEQPRVMLVETAFEAAAVDVWRRSRRVIDRGHPRTKWEFGGGCYRHRVRQGECLTVVGIRFAGKAFDAVLVFRSSKASLRRRRNSVFALPLHLAGKRRDSEAGASEAFSLGQ